MLVAAAVCPHPPLIVPAVAAGAASELDDLRDACAQAVSVLSDAAADVLFVVGDAPEKVAYSAADWGDFARYGVRLPVRLGTGACTGQPLLPLSLTVGAWLLHEFGYRGDRQGYGAPANTTPSDCVEIGRQISAVSPRVALLVMGDGSARRTEKAPGYLDARAENFDAAVEKALATADTASLLDIDVTLADELLVAGRASWQVLAGAGDQHRWEPVLHYSHAPYGVGYFVATWTR